MPSPTRLSLLLVVILGLGAGTALSQTEPPEPTGGTAPSPALQISADHQEQTGTGTFLFDGNVRIVYRDIEVHADRVEVNKDRRQLAAEGNVLVVSGKLRLSGARAEIDLDSQTGSIFEGYALVDENFIVRGERIDKVDVDRFVVYQGEITACDQAIPQWSIKTSRAKVRLEGYAQLANARVNVKKVPVIYTPYLVFPVKTERSSGFLFPHFGSSQSRGSVISEAFYLVLGRSMDASIYADWYSKAGVAPGVQIRYAPADGVSGELYGFYLKDKRDDSESWRYSANHQQTLGRNFRLIANANVVDDQTYAQEFERNLSNYSNRSSFWKAALTGNFAVFSLNVEAEDRDDFFTYFSSDPQGNLLTREQTITTSRLPSAEVRGRETKLFGPVYFSFEASAANLERTELRTQANTTPGGPEIVGYEADYVRLDAFPMFTFRVPGLPWLSVTPRLGGRYTSWSKSLDPMVTTETVVLDESVERTYAQAELELLGPRFAKIWERTIEREDEEDETRRYKHLIEPQINFKYISDIDEAGQIPIFDRIDQILPQNEVKYGVMSRLYVKRSFTEPDPLRPPVEYHYIYDSTCNCYQKRPTTAATGAEGETSGFGEQVFAAPPDADQTVHELFRVSLFQRYSLDPELPTEYGRRYNVTGSLFQSQSAYDRYSPATLSVDWFPNRLSNLNATVDYATQEREPTTVGGEPPDDLVRASVSLSVPRPQEPLDPASPT